MDCEDRQGNWFAINRKLISSEFWTSEPFSKPQAWIDLIGLARWQDGTGYKRGIEFPVKRGQLCWSEVRLAERWGWSRRKINRFLKTLKSRQQIEQQKNNVTTIITILNYDMYQPKDTADGAPKGTPNEQQKHTKEEGKEGKEGKKEKSNTDIFLEKFNAATGKKHRIMPDKAKRQFGARLKAGYTIDDMVEAATNAARSDHHRNDGLRNLTPEFITRGDKLEMWLNSGVQTEFEEKSLDETKDYGEGWEQ